MLQGMATPGFRLAQYKAIKTEFGSRAAEGLVGSVATIPDVIAHTLGRMEGRQHRSWAIVTSVAICHRLTASVAGLFEICCVTSHRERLDLCDGNVDPQPHEVLSRVTVDCTVYYVMCTHPSLKSQASC